MSYRIYFNKRLVRYLEYPLRLPGVGAYSSCFLIIIKLYSVHDRGFIFKSVGWDVYWNMDV